jgi:hypothetical protein
MVAAITIRRILRSSWPLAGIGAVLLAGLGGCGQSPATPQQSSASQPAAFSSTVDMDASWSIRFADVKSAKQASDVVVKGTITSIQFVGYVKNDLGQDDHIVFTDYVFTIDQRVADARHLITGPTIVIHQTGGILNGIKHEIQDDPLFQIHEQAVLFLKIYRPGYGYVMGGPSGRFMVHNGVVQPRSQDGGMDSMKGRVVSVADFVTQVQSA